MQNKLAHKRSPEKSDRSSINAFKVPEASDGETIVQVVKQKTKGKANSPETPQKSKTV